MNTLFFVQIILESLPISSSGHLKLLSTLNPFLISLTKFEELLAHVPTLFLLIFTFYKIGKEWFLHYRWPRLLKDIFYLGLITSITFMGYLMKYYLNEHYDLSFINMPLYYGPFLNTIVLYHLYFKDKEIGYREYISKTDILWFGLAQSIALCGWISRFAITLYMGLKLGLSRKYALYISCALQFFICLGGGILAFGYAHFKPEILMTIDFTIRDFFILILSMIFSWLLLKLVIHYFLRGRLWLLYLYSMSLGILIFLWDILYL
jgi:undecaprenyl pyrophosphate phosphatase UppP